VDAYACLGGERAALGFSKVLDIHVANYTIVFGLRVGLVQKEMGRIVFTMRPI